MLNVILAVYVVFTLCITTLCICNRSMPKSMEIMLVNKDKARKWALPFIAIISMLEAPAIILYVIISLIITLYVCGTDASIRYGDYFKYLMGEKED